jgi:aminopeptidase 2
LQPLVVEGGNKSIKHGVLLTDREDTFEIENVEKATYKLNAETCGVCEFLGPAFLCVDVGV